MASFANFQADVVRRGFEHVSRVRAELQNAHPELKLEVKDLMRWAYERLSAGKAREAIPLMRLAVQISPSGATHLGLTESYQRFGGKALAEENNRKALELDPDNFVVKIVAKEGLDELKESPKPPAPRGR